MDTRPLTPAAAGEASTERPSVPPKSGAVPESPSPVPIPGWASDDALSEFPTEAEVRSGRRPAAPTRKASPASLPVWGIAAGLVLIGAMVVAWRWLPRQPEVPAPVATGTLAIESSPPGATVVIEGRERGTTPLTVSLSPATYRVAVTGATGSRELTVEVRAGGQVVHHVELGEAAPTTGRIHVTAPAGAPVFLDGKRAGVAPAELTGVPAGDHAVTVGEGVAAASQRVSVPAGGVASLLVPLAQPAGAMPAWISVAAPIDLQVFDGETLIGTSSTDRILLLAGRHTLRLVNAALEYQTTRVVQADAGRVAMVRVDVPNGVLNVNAVPWAEVFVDGKPAGQTPIANLAVPIGSHEVVLRNPKFAEQKRSVVISLAGPTRLGVDLRQ